MPPWCEPGATASTRVIQATPAAQAGVTSVRSQNGTLLAVTQGGWTSWSAVNEAWVLAFDQDRLITGGHSGLAFWNPGSLKLTMNVVTGLPNPAVTAILVDEDRSLWIGTQEGLVNMVGDKWIPYSQNEGLGGNQVNAIARIGKRVARWHVVFRRGRGLI